MNNWNDSCKLCLPFSPNTDDYRICFLPGDWLMATDPGKFHSLPGCYYGRTDPQATPDKKTARKNSVRECCLVTRINHLIIVKTKEERSK